MFPKALELLVNAALLTIAKNSPCDFVKWCPCQITELASCKTCKNNIYATVYLLRVVN